MSAVGWGASLLFPRLRSMVPAAGSTAQTVPADLPVAGSYGLVALVELVLLLGVVAVAVEDRLVDRPHLPLEPELADRVGRGDELLDRGLHQGEVEPPLRLRLAAVPVEELGEDPAGVLLLRALGDVRGDVLRERLDAPAGSPRAARPPLRWARRPRPSAFRARSRMPPRLPSAGPPARSASSRSRRSRPGCRRRGRRGSTAGPGAPATSRTRRGRSRGGSSGPRASACRASRPS